MNEDTRGNTIAATSLWGDRLDEYDYDDYGRPIHSPVALDGRWIAGITAGPWPDVSEVTLSHPIAHTSSLVCSELRLVKNTPSGAGDVYVSGNVISNMGTIVHIHDPGGLLAAA